LIERHLGFVEMLARKFLDRGEPLEDLVQQGVIGLIHAVDRFDPERGVQFETYAASLILGELKRYFRDRSWSLKVPRYLRDLNVRVRNASDRLTARLGRSPTPAEVAAELHTTEERVLEALEIGSVYDVVSLDSGFSWSDEDDGGPLSDRVGLLDTTLEDYFHRSCLQEAIAELEPRQQRIIWYRYFDNLSQNEVARLEGISQMHVSRLQRRALQQMHEFLTC
jgi:RNA polymerase sigma-B factor